jgi:hypothetical protein
MIPVSARKTKDVSAVNETSLLTFMAALYRKVRSRSLIAPRSIIASYNRRRRSARPNAVSLSAKAAPVAGGFHRARCPVKSPPALQDSQELPRCLQPAQERTLDAVSAQPVAAHHDPRLRVEQTASGDASRCTSKAPAVSVEV